MKKNSVSMAIALSLALSTAVAQQTVTGRHGGTATGSVTQKGTTVSGSGTATSAGGNTASAQGSVTKTRTGTTETGSVTGPKGGTTTASWYNHQQRKRDHHHEWNGHRAKRFFQERLGYPHHTPEIAVPTSIVALAPLTRSVRPSGLLCLLSARSHAFSPGVDLP